MKKISSYIFHQLTQGGYQMFKANVVIVLKIILVFLVMSLGYIAPIYFTSLGLVVLLILIYIVRHFSVPDENFTSFRGLIDIFLIMIVSSYLVNEILYYTNTDEERLVEIIREIKRLIIK